MRLKQKLGAVFLPLVLIIGGILIEIAAAAGVLTLLGINSSQSVRASAEALQVARAGTADALMQITNDKNFLNPYYNVPINSRNAYVSVLRDIPVIGQTSIYSQATILNRTRILFSLISVDSVTGEINLISTTEVTTFPLSE